MQSRHRNGPGKGYRSNATGMGSVAVGSHSLPEGTTRGSRMYNLKYRNYNRGSQGRVGHSKQFQLPLETDIFMEAGKLAAEYLVSNGVLPSNALSGKWQNGVLKKQIDSCSMDAPGDVGPGARRHCVEYNSMGSRSFARVSTGAESNHNIGRKKPWSGRNRDSSCLEAEGASSGHLVGQPVDKEGDGGGKTSSPGELTQESNNMADPESGGACAKTRCSDNEKDLQSNADEEVIKDSNEESQSGTGEAKKGCHDIDLEQKEGESTEVTASAEKDLESKDDIDSGMHCEFENVSTKTYSSSSMRGMLLDPNPITEDENINKNKLSEGSGLHATDMLNDSSAGIASSGQSHELKSIDSDILKGPTVEENVGVTRVSRTGLCSKARSFLDRSVLNDQEVDKELQEFRRSSSMFMESGEKRALVASFDGREGTKKLREWAPLRTRSDDCLPRANSMETQHNSHKPETSSSKHVILSPDQKSLCISLFPKGHAESCQYTEEKQLFPGSFKTFDLNLIETCDGNENITGSAKLEAPIDVDLSISNCYSRVSNKNGKHGVDDKDIEVIDLEIDSVYEDKTFTPERRADTVFTGPDSFPNNVHDANEIPDIRDGYGFVMSELLGNDRPECSSVPTELDSQHNDLGLHNGEGTLYDDDQIYMSLGEIPFSMCLLIFSFI
ncbi:Hypothetical predicted protein [Olea europaea subsp. europaea]|uniref:Uncharacterized protein n=1 Tax=Olea europaea subsp. europaea TaxID=158383 RepID=A0A8S0S7Z9_OLEEU|nr:Hypothetical predicted protein [Olea europaea subsp. europaea]